MLQRYKNLLKNKSTRHYGVNNSLLCGWQGGSHAYRMKRIIAWGGCLRVLGMLAAFFVKYHA
jgi:hypothetical protein